MNKINKIKKNKKNCAAAYFTFKNILFNQFLIVNKKFTSISVFFNDENCNIAWNIITAIQYFHDDMFFKNTVF